MIQTFKSILRRYLVGDQIADSDSSFNVLDIEVITSFLANPDFPWLISFPRTGSHWLRMIMELYLEKPSLVRVFYYKDSKDFTCIHRHDLDLSFVGCRNVLYLYRNPVDTIYSQLSFNEENINDTDRIRNWAELYGKHLSKWLIEETFTVKKTVITYEGMENDMYGMFEKVCDFFDTPFDGARLDGVMEHISKEKVKKKVKDSPKVVNLTEAYEDNRIAFRERYSDLIYDHVVEQNEKLESKFEFFGSK